MDVDHEFDNFNSIGFYLFCDATNRRASLLSLLKIFILTQDVDVNAARRSSVLQGSSLDLDHKLLLFALWPSSPLNKDGSPIKLELEECTLFRFHIYILPFRTFASCPWIARAWLTVGE